ncbi:hypothetical protein YN1HA_5130 [Sulfurisphaera ohwakuensis]
MFIMFIFKIIIIKWRKKFKQAMKYVKIWRKWKYQKSSSL